MRIIEQLLPDPVVRTAVLESFAESIREADRLTNGVWKVSVHKAGAVWLNVSRWAMVGIEPDKMWITVQELALGEDLKGELDRLQWTEPCWYRVPSRLLWVTMPPSHVRGTYERCANAHFAALQDIANYQIVKHKMRFHSTAFLDYLRGNLGLELPDPDI